MTTTQAFAPATLDVKLGRPATHANAAARQKAWREAHKGAVKSVRFSGKTPASIKSIADALDRTEAEVIDAAVKFAFANHNFKTLGLPFDGARDDKRTSTGKVKRVAGVDDLMACCY